MAEDTRPDAAQTLALDARFTGRPLTKIDLERVVAKLGKFENSLREHESQSEANKKKQTEYHCLVIAGYLGRGYKSPASMDEAVSTEEAVLKACQDHFKVRTATEMAERINVILESGGGSLDSAYRIMLFLRKFADKIHVYVPWRAKSSATLIAIGADQIVMSPYAELGPLDTQISDPRSPTALVSALDCYLSVDYVRDFGVESISRALDVMLDQTQKALPLSQLVDSATDFAAANVEPMLEQVKALDFGGWGRTLKIGETYAKQLRLRLHPDSEEEAVKLATKLVYGYTHHHYPIDDMEANNLGLAVQEMPDDIYAAAKSIAHACRQEARFVGFSADAEKAIEQLGNRTVGGHAIQPSNGFGDEPHAVSIVTLGGSKRQRRGFLRWFGL